MFGEVWVDREKISPDSASNSHRSSMPCSESVRGNWKIGSCWNGRSLSVTVAWCWVYVTPGESLYGLVSPALTGVPDGTNEKNPALVSSVAYANVRYPGSGSSVWK